MLITLLVLFGALLLLNDGICVASENITNDTTTLLNTTNATSDLNTTTEQDTQAAGETTSESTTTTLKEQYNNSHGIWIRSDDIAQINVTALVNAGITDVYVKVSRLVDYQTTLDNLGEVKEKLSSSGIRIHAWITCFKDANGNWVDPLGTYSYTVQVPYQKTVKQSYKQWYKGWYKKYYTKWTKKWYKKWYKSGSKWKYKWKYTWKKVTKYYKKYGWYYVWKYKYVTTTAYKTETRYGTDTSLNAQLVQFATNLASSNLVDGIHLDYVRYPGTAYKHTGGTAAITNFVANVNTAVKSVNSSIALSAALMPEGSINAYFYGQDYSQLANYLDFLVPMVYKGSYEQNTDWIGTKTAYIVSKAGATPVIVGLQTYVSDSNLTPLSAAELNLDISKALECGASGYALFRFGLIDTNFLAGSDFDAASAGSVSASTSTEATDDNAETISFPIATSTYSADLQQYLQSTTNCQSTDSRIIALAQSITANATSTYEMAQFIYNWVRDEVEYSFYYNSQKGAVNTMLNRAGNCCDLSHLIVALCRAAGIPALYKHGTCNFASGTYGHVWAQVYVNGNWINADASNNANSFGIITNWDTSSYTLKGTYASLPF
jgi:transglutaminase-like putative cysteine protease